MPEKETTACGGAQPATQQVAGEESLIAQDSPDDVEIPGEAEQNKNTSG